MRSLVAITLSATFALSIGGASVASAGRGGAIAVPPTTVDVGVLAPLIGGDAVGPATDVLVGIHWAAIAWRPTTFDVGVGYVGSFRGLVPGRGREIARSRTGEVDDTFALHGGYLSIGRTLSSDRNFRTWVEARGELLRGSLGDRSFSAVGGALRISAELYASGFAAAGRSNSIAMVAGTFALGVYVEASHRDVASELGPTGVAGGFTVRVPFLLAAAN